MGMPVEGTEARALIRFHRGDRGGLLELIRDRAFDIDQFTERSPPLWDHTQAIKYSVSDPGDVLSGLFRFRRRLPIAPPRSAVKPWLVAEA